MPSISAAQFGAKLAGGFLWSLLLRARAVAAAHRDNPRGPARADERSRLPAHHAPDLPCRGRVGVMLASDKRGADPMASSYDTQLIEAAGASLDAYLENTCLFAEQRSLFLGTLHALVSSIDAKDPYTRGHPSASRDQRAHRAGAGLSRRPRRARPHRGPRARRGQDRRARERALQAGRLTDDEFASIKRHPEIGQRILAGIPLLADVLPGVLHHHERLDGKGYPHRLAGEGIPEIARIIAVADTFDAMSSSRSYRAAMPRERSLPSLRAARARSSIPGRSTRSSRWTWRSLMS